MIIRFFKKHALVISGFIVLVGFMAAPAPVHAAVPAMSTAQYFDSNSDGTVDQVKFTFSGTPLTRCDITPTDVASDWVWNGKTTIAGTLSTTATCDLSTGVVTLQITGANPAATGTAGGLAASPTIRYINGTTGGSSADSIANADGAAATMTPAGVPVADKAAPAIVSANYADLNGDVMMDAIRFTFSEAVTTASFLSANDLVFTDTAGFTGAAFGTNGTNLITAQTTYVDVPLGTQASVVRSSATGSLGISTQNSFSLVDIIPATPNINNTLGPLTQMTTIDGMYAYPLTLTYQDADSDGKIDQAVIYFSEPIVASSIISANLIGFTNVGDFTGMAFGSSATDLVTSTTQDVIIPLGVEASVVDTIDTSGTIDIEIYDGFSVSDGINSYTLSGGPYPLALTILDGAPPFFTETTSITSPTSDTTPEYVFNLSEAGTLAYGGSCTSTTTSGSAGSNTITFDALGAGVGYSNCTITITDSNSNGSIAFPVTPFTVSIPYTAPTSVGSGGIVPVLFLNTGISGQSLVAQPQTSIPSNSFETKFTYTRDLKLGMAGDDVLKLQQFLNKQGYVVSLIGAGSKGNETRYFGPATFRALVKFQAENGIKPASGFFGPISRGVVNGIK